MIPIIKRKSGYYIIHSRITLDINMYIYHLFCPIYNIYNIQGVQKLNRQNLKREKDTSK